MALPKVSTTDYDKLTDEEKDIVHTIIQDTDINLLRYNQNKIDLLVNKFKILKGEILIGNDNMQLIRDLRAVVIQLVNHNILRLRDITPLLEQIFLLL